MRKPTPLKRAIFEAQLTQRDLAREVGMDPAQFSRIVNGLHVNEATEQKIAAAVGRDVSELFGDLEDAA
jgi:transcriptional regulator with XRE-family HTH domain